MTPVPMTHDEALEMAGLYALDALTPGEKAACDAHMANCALDHSELAELGGVGPALASVAEPVDAPAALKNAVLAAYRSEMGTAQDVVATAADAVKPVAEPTKPWNIDADAPHASRQRVPNWMGWAAAGVAIVLLAVLGVYGLNLRQQVDDANQRAEQITQAVAALTAPGSQVAILQGSGAASGITGFVAVPAGGSGYMVMTDVPAAPSGMTYQAWYIVDGQPPASAGTMTAEPDGTVIATGLQPLPGTDVIAVTVEPTGGSAQPTSAPIITGDVTTRT